MIHADSIKAAADDLIAAALIGDGWNEALTRFAHAAEARHAVLMRNAPKTLLTVLSNEEAAEPIGDYLAGRAPPNSRYARVSTQRAGSFRVDHDDYTDEMLARDPYYQEFLRPNRIFWHANAVLARGGDDYVELSLKRAIGLGPYQREDASILDSVLPELNAAARIARNILDAETRGMTLLLRRRGRLIIEIDSRGRVLPGQAAGEADPSSPLRIRGLRLASVDPQAQPMLDRALATATAQPGRVALASLIGPDGRRYLLQIHPVPGAARDVFLSATAIALLIERDRKPSPVNEELPLLRDAFGLTDREAEVASLLAQGFDIAAIARALGIRPETARTYLKDALEKTGTHRQAELAALLAGLGR